MARKNARVILQRHNALEKQRFPGGYAKAISCLALISLTVALLCYLPADNVPEKNKQDILSSATFVDSYYRSNKRLPTKEEFDQWREEKTPVSIVDYEIHPASSSDKEYYVLFSWAGEHMWLYNSRTGKIFLQPDS